ncbi:unnamed protein product [Heligmosomoides polygyrus]|uniref:C6 domain-containing protein n=1 Tax=Heligmosomoides polygyrus TaxID=6339 RepID=A0A183GUV5_HELPZ|nr:unnamed protein product [Heligmosomoides polygyrus]
MEPPAAQTTQMSCVSGQWITTINGVQTVVQQQACYLFSCTLCPAVIGGTGVTVTIGYNPTTWCKLYTLSGCANGYRVATVTGSRTITGPLTCDALLRWGSGSFNGNVGQAVTVNCVL